LTVNELVAMVIKGFPPVSEADEYGLLAIGGDLEVESLLLAYSNGIFPWPIDDLNLTWFAPPRRAVLFLDDFHCSKSLRRSINKTDRTFSINRRFDEVISRCAETINRPGERGTWITDQIQEAYCKLHLEGFAHSFECYNREELIGGVYGVSVGGVFAAESMFYREDDASKMTLQYMVQYLGAQNVPWIDAQVLNPFLKSMGFKEIPRARYMKLLQERLSAPTLKFPAPGGLHPLERLKLAPRIDE
jgi:leucyl/phenylalanyl-tRNA--protein transferase